MILLEVCIGDTVSVTLGTAQNGSVAIVPVLPADTALQPEEIHLHHASVVRVPRGVNSKVVICRKIFNMEHISVEQKTYQVIAPTVALSKVYPKLNLPYWYRPFLR